MDENMTEDKICTVSGLDKNKRSAMARYFGRLSEAERVESVKIAIDLAKQFMGKVDPEMLGKPDFLYTMICLSLWKMSWSRHDLAKKNPALTEKEAKEIAEKRLASVFSKRKDRMKNPKKKILLDLRYYHVVAELRCSGVSWRECQEFLKKYHKMKISHVYLRQIYEQITKERIARGDHEISS